MKDKIAEFKNFIEEIKEKEANPQGLSPPFENFYNKLLKVASAQNCIESMKNTIFDFPKVINNLATIHPQKEYIPKLKNHI